VGQWQGGFQGELTVANRTTAASRGWTATVTFANGQVISQVWNGAVSQSGGRATVTNAAYNGVVAPNAGVTTGFIASWTGTNAAPTVACALQF
jgi:cellulase/cellobiase CelA1